MRTNPRSPKARSAFVKRNPQRSRLSAKDSFLPFVRSTRAGKPNTVRFYKNSVANLSAYSKLADLPLDQINSEIVAGFVARRQLDQVQVSTINRDLATLRRMFHLAI